MRSRMSRQRRQVCSLLPSVLKPFRQFPDLSRRHLLISRPTSTFVPPTLEPARRSQTNLIRTTIITIIGAVCCQVREFFILVQSGLRILRRRSDAATCALVVLLESGRQSGLGDSGACVSFSRSDDDVCISRLSRSEREERVVVVVVARSERRRASIASSKSGGSTSSGWARLGTWNQVVGRGGAKALSRSKSKTGAAQLSDEGED